MAVAVATAPPEAPLPALTEPDGTLDAIALLEVVLTKSNSPLLQRRILHARERLLRELESHLFGGVSRTPDSTDQVLALLKDSGQALRQAGQALRFAAEQLKFAGRLGPANATITASRHAFEAAEGLG